MSQKQPSKQYRGPDRRKEKQGFGLAPMKREGGWNYDVAHGGVERRHDSPDYSGYWERQKR